MQGTRRERVTKFQKKINTFWLQQHSNNLILGGKGGADSSLFMCTGVPISTLGGHLPVTHGLVVYTCPLLEAGPQPGSLTISLNAHCRNIQGNKPSLHVWQSASLQFVQIKGRIFPFSPIFFGNSYIICYHRFTACENPILILSIVPTFPSTASTKK